MRALFLAAGLVAASQAVSAQTPFVYKPIDANKLIVKPTDAASGLAAGASQSTFRTITRTVAGAVENNGFVRTINNLLGRRAQPQTMQAGYSPLPQTSTYQSTGYQNSFQPQMPVTQAYGRSPSLALPASPSAQR